MNSYKFQHNSTRIFSATAQQIVFLILSVIVSISAKAEANNDTPKLVLTSFDVSINNNKVSLYWVTGMEKDFSHFVIERSSDGVQYTDAAVVFANGNSEMQQLYFFADALKGSNNKVLHYRLRMVSANGKYSHSAAKSIQPGTTVKASQLQLYPNPVANELRITIPEAWQSRNVGYELYNGNGQLVKKMASQATGQMQTVNMQGMGAGVYMVKAYSGADTAIQWILKK